MKPSTLLKLFSCATLLFPFVADALEMPQEKLGLWEMRQQNSSNGGPLTAPYTMQYCVTTELLETVRKATEEKSKNCSKNEVRKEGSKWIQNSICKSAGITMSSQTTHEILGENAYHFDTNGTFDPPLARVSRSHVVRDGKWLGPCK